jgi:SET domain-containing protein
MLVKDGIQFTNHSCRPNSFMKVLDVEKSPTIEFVALKPIQEGEQLTFDYNSTEWDMASPFRCNCSISSCMVRGAKHLEPADMDKLKSIATPYIMSQASKREGC